MYLFPDLVCPRLCFTVEFTMLHPPIIRMMEQPDGQKVDDLKSFSSWFRQQTEIHGLAGHNMNELMAGLAEVCTLRVLLYLVQCLSSWFKTIWRIVSESVIWRPYTAYIAAVWTGIPCISKSFIVRHTGLNIFRSLEYHCNVYIRFGRSGGLIKLSSEAAQKAVDYRSGCLQRPMYIVRPFVRSLTLRCAIASRRKCR